MWLNVGLQFLIVTVFATFGDARLTSKVDLQNENGLAGCEKDVGPNYWPYSNTICNTAGTAQECEKNLAVREKCKFSCSPSGHMWWAASTGNLTEINSAIAAGANPLCQKTLHISTFANFENMTALHAAALGNNPDVVVALLNAGVDVNLQTTDGKTPTFHASQNSSIDALEVLIEHGADVNIAAADGTTPIHVAGRQDLHFTPTGFILKNDQSTTKALIKANANLDAIITEGPVGGTALYNAAYGNNIEKVLLLIEHNADVNIRAADTNTALMEVARLGYLSIAKALIDANASINLRGVRDSTALYIAVEYSNLDIVSLLIEHNADVNIPDYRGVTPLMRSVWYGGRFGRLNITEALINANASINTTGGPDNATALHYAVYSESYADHDPNDTVLLLLQSGADTTILDREGRTPAARARHHERYDLADLIEEYSTSSTH